MERACMIKTAYGASPELDTLRDFRDDVFLENELGRKFVAYYYKNSPLIAGFIIECSMVKLAIKEAGIKPVIKVVKSTKNIWKKEK